jgi:3D (Asp-Asp-Asp) domain-containing protein
VLISRSLWRKAFATTIVAMTFVWLFEVTILDSRFALPRPFSAAPAEPRPEPGKPLLFSATAYCKGTTTTSGVNVRSGIAAADPDLLPVGSVIQVDAPGARHDGVYTIMDTGPKVQGRRLDLYMWSCYEALAFGRTGVKIVLLRLGWNPQASTPGIIERLFRRREAAAQQQAAELPADYQKQIPPSTLPDPAPAPQDTAPVPPATTLPPHRIAPVPALPDAAPHNPR